ncbi:MAG: MBL fold metallo-hydrolase [Planctomycetota bacterium]|nr:MBL fold metallo-hydrolase [Planctomycetota bacterium]
MTTIHHINCGTLRVPNFPTVVCHCLLLEENGRLALIDTGIGLLEVASPAERLGKALIDMAGFQFNEHDTAVRRIEQLGFQREQVQDIVMTHLDPDHAGGLADFPDATVHVAEEEMQNVLSENPRYVPRQFEHSPRWQTYAPSTEKWFGLAARPVPLPFSTKVLLIPLPGHTLGHCGVAMEQENGWLLHVGDAYYLRAELTEDKHPVSALATLRADNDEQRRSSLAGLRRPAEEYGAEVEMFGYHDLTELPGGLL